MRKIKPSVSTVSTIIISKELQDLNRIHALELKRKRLEQELQTIDFQLSKEKELDTLFSEIDIETKKSDKALFYIKIVSLTTLGIMGIIGLSFLAKKITHRNPIGFRP